MQISLHGFGHYLDQVSAFANSSIFVHRLNILVQGEECHLSQGSNEMCTPYGTGAGGAEVCSEVSVWDSLFPGRETDEKMIPANCLFAPTGELLTSM